MFLEYYYEKTKYDHNVKPTMGYKHIINLTDSTPRLCTCKSRAELEGKTKDDVDCNLDCVRDFNFQDELFRVVGLLYHSGFIDDRMKKDQVEICYKDHFVINLYFKKKEDAAEFKMLYEEYPQ